MTQQEHFTENTLFKVYDVLRANGLTEPQARDAINEMQNQGILFRERMSTDNKNPVIRTGRYRGYRLRDDQPDEDEE